MATSTRKPVLALFACLFAGCLAASLCGCASQVADENGRDLASTSPTEQATDAEAASAEATSDDQTAQNADSEEEPAPASGADAASPTATPTAQAEGSPSAEPADSSAEADAAATTATIMYYENVNYDDGDVKPDDEGHVLLGTYELKNVHVGQTLNAWDYVVDIPGYFFWDGWPQNITLSENPADNVIKLFYFKLWNNTYTVNYYLMENADLSADNWKDALKPDDVKFIKMGSETFTNQRFDKLVKGDAYEYKIDGTYVVDTYPAEIRVGVNPDDNVINVLYVPDSPNIPDNVEIPDDTTNPDDSATQPDDGSSTPDEPVDTPADDNGTPSLPDDTTFDKNEITDTLPSKDEVINDFIASGDAQDKVEITDEMIENPVSKSDADYVKNVYETGLREGEKLAQTGDRTAFVAVAIVAGGAAIVAVIAFARSRLQRRR